MERTGLFRVKGVMDKDNDTDEGCPIFGVQSGGPVIGLGLLMILFGLVPLVAGLASMPVGLVMLFFGFGLFLIWVGVTC